MSDTRQALLDDIAGDELNVEHRAVYADWLDERGEHEEADRQRKYVPAFLWLREFVLGDACRTSIGDYQTRHFHSYATMTENERRRYGNEYSDEERREHPDNIASAMGQLCEFLKAHAMVENGDNVCLPFDTPYSGFPYSSELWENFEIVTGNPSPNREARDGGVYIPCAC